MALLSESNMSVRGTRNDVRRVVGRLSLVGRSMVLSNRLCIRSRRSGFRSMVGTVGGCEPNMSRLIGCRMCSEVDPLPFGREAVERCVSVFAPVMRMDACRMVGGRVVRRCRRRFLGRKCRNSVVE